MSNASGASSRKRCAGSWCEPAAERPWSHAGAWRLAAALALPALLLALWEALARRGALSPLFFPPPTVVARTFLRMIASGQLPAAAGITVRRLVVGFIAGAAPGLVLGLLMGASPRVRRAVDPLVAALHPVPKMALLPILMILLGLGEAPRLALPALGAFFPLAISAMAGVRQISPICFEVAANYRAGPLKVFGDVVLPGSLPLVLAGVRIGFNTALHIVIASELVYGRTGLGAIVWYAWETMRVEELYAAVAATALLGIVFNALLKRLVSRMTPWQPSPEV